MRNIYTLIALPLWIVQICGNTLSRPGFCIPNEPCVFDCSVDSICEEGDLHCASGQSCDVLCANDNACKNANIFGNSASTLTVACSAKTACGDANIDGTAVHSVIVSCAGVDSCKGDTHVICGQSKCSVHCPISTGCEQLHIDSSKTSSYHCTGPFCTDIGTVVPTKYLEIPQVPGSILNEIPIPVGFTERSTSTTTTTTEAPQIALETITSTTTTTTTEAPLHANVYAANNLPPGVVIPPGSIPPGAEYVVVLPATLNNIVTNVEKGTRTILDMCEGDCDFDSDCSGDLKCYQRDYDNRIVPGCIGRPYKGWDYCTRGEMFIVSTTTTTAAPGLPFVARSNQVDLDDDGLNNNVDNVVVSFSAESVRNIWILIILFLVVNGGIAYFYCFRSRSKGMGTVRMIFDEETNSNI